VTAQRWLILWLIVGLALRLAASAGLDPIRPYAGTGGDSGWYLANGYALATGIVPCPDAFRFPRLAEAMRALAYHHPDGLPYTCTLTDVRRLPTPPLYLYLLGALQGIFGFQSAAAVTAARLGQIALSVATIGLLAGIARAIAGRRAGVAAAAIAALHPGLIVESGQIVSETLFLTLIAAGLLAFIRGVNGARRPALALSAAGVCFGLAALTRASALAFPLALIALAGGIALRDRRARLIPGLVAFALIYALTVGSWTLYNLIRYDRLVIGGEGLAAFLYIGATGWADPQAVDQRLAQQIGMAAGAAEQDDFVAAAGAAIGSDPAAYLRRRVDELVSAVLQPHGTTYYGGPSLRALAADWWRGDRSPGGLIALTQTEAFWPKLLLYLAHVGVIGLASIGLWRMRARWRVTLALAGWIAYLLAVHLVLLALPRYLFPALAAAVPLAGCAFAPRRNRS
jgi:4-amino-4-deoxy-L-arabinose transferase-like glycosyltransferase